MVQLALASFSAFTVSGAPQPAEADYHMAPRPLDPRAKAPFPTGTGVSSYTGPTYIPTGSMKVEVDVSGKGYSTGRMVSIPAGTGTAASGGLRGTGAKDIKPPIKTGS